MSNRKSKTCKYNHDFLLQPCKSKEDFLRLLSQHYGDKLNINQLYLDLISRLKDSILNGNVESFKHINNLLGYINDSENHPNISYCQEDDDNPLKHTNIIILSCKHNQLEILKYILDNYKIIFKNLFLSSKHTISPNDKDDSCHNVFYYSIRSGNIKMLEILIEKWPDNYFAVDLEKLDEFLSEAFEELKLRNVPLSEEVDIFVQNKLINIRFFSKNSNKNENDAISFTIIKERIELVLKDILLLNSTEKVEEKFLFVLKSIAQNIHILKRQLKSTYNVLPWEEIEFCLVTFISSYVKHEEINLLYRATLTQSQILKHLYNFAVTLMIVKDNFERSDIRKINVLPNIKREDNVAQIVKANPSFIELYDDYKTIRDPHSLQKIDNYIKLASSVDPKNREGQLIIIRSLQVIGEYLKNTLESPKLSDFTSNRLLLFLPENTRKIVIDLRNSLSHAYSLSKRIEIEENKDVEFFRGVQNDSKKIGKVINDILYDYKIKSIVALLKKILKSEKIEEVIQISEILKNFKLESYGSLLDFNLAEHEKLEKLIKELKNNVTTQTSYEKSIFNEMENLIISEKNKMQNNKNNHQKGILYLQNLSISLTIHTIDKNNIRIMKYFCRGILESMPKKVEHQSLKQIGQLAIAILHSNEAKEYCENLFTISRLIYEIFYIVEYDLGSIGWVNKLRRKLLKKKPFSDNINPQKHYGTSKEDYDNHLISKLSELKDVLGDDILENELKVSSRKLTDKVQVIEMLVLDILSILSIYKYSLQDNLGILDDNAPLLIGKYLRNHLAHDNVLVNILLDDPSIALILNAKQLITKDIINNRKRIGGIIEKDFSCIKNRHDNRLSIVINQEKMFTALTEGNLECLKSYMAEGADINGKNIDLCSAIHFAAKQNNISILKFLLDLNLRVDVKDINKQNPLHIAAIHGSHKTVEFFLKEKFFDVNSVDGKGATPLHMAAKYGQKDVVNILFHFRVNAFAKDCLGYTAFHYAVENNRKDIVEFFLQKQMNPNITDIFGGFTPLHVAAEKGHLDIVNILIKYKANIHAKTTMGQVTPLHLASLNGQLEVVKFLISKGSKINVKNVDDCTPLHYATEHGHTEVVEILLNKGAHTNVFDNAYHNTPLHYAAEDGYKEIVKVLLKHNSNVDAVTVAGVTPLKSAVKNGHFKIVEILLKHGVNIHNHNNIDCLHLAVMNGHKQIVELLIRYKADVDAIFNGITPMHLASSNAYGDIVNLLIKNKAKIDIRDEIGSTPLFEAADRGSKEVLDILIKNNADINAKDHLGLTPLHKAVIKGHLDAVDFLVKSEADVNSTCIAGIRPLDAAVIHGHADVVELLVKSKVNVNSKNIAGYTALHIAAATDHVDVVKVLIANGANVKIKNNDNLTPLSIAVRQNKKEIVKVLINGGSDVNCDNGDPLLYAVSSGNKYIAELLLQNKARIHVKDPELSFTLLHIAAKNPRNKDLINLLISEGLDVNSEAKHQASPLYVATFGGCEENVKTLIANGAKISSKNGEGWTALHVAAKEGHDNLVKILLDHGIDINVKDEKNRTALEIAVAYSRFQVVKILLPYSKMNINYKGNDDYTLLHIAAQEGDLKITQLLVQSGADINAINLSGSKPIHIAAREGHVDIVEYFCSQGQSINELGIANKTLLHYAASTDQIKVAEFLIEKGVDVNIRDWKGRTPLHIAAQIGNKSFIQFLIENGAFYNSVDIFKVKPIEMTDNKDVTNLLDLIEKFFKAVKQNDSLEVKKYIATGAIVNAKNADNVTSLHYAAWKGYEEIVDILLKNNSNPNITGKKSLTALHYAAKFSHLDVLKSLLAGGAIYNSVSDNGKTPLDFAEDKNIINLFQLIIDTFERVKNKDCTVINDLKKIEDLKTIKAIMDTFNAKKETLITIAMHNKFPKVDNLKLIFQDDLSDNIRKAEYLFAKEKYYEALTMFRKILEKKKEILGRNNPGTLDLEEKIATILIKQENYSDALKTLQEIADKRKIAFGENHEDTLRSRSKIALILHKLKKYQEALNIYKNVYEKQKVILKANDPDILNTQNQMALALNDLNKFDEALKIKFKVFEKQKIILGSQHPETLTTQNNIAMILKNQGKYGESLKIYQDVYKTRKSLLGPTHTDTLNSFHCINEILNKQGKNKIPFDISLLGKTLEPGQSNISNPQTEINDAKQLPFFQSGENKLKFFNDLLLKRKALLGPDHPSILEGQQMLEMLKFQYNKMEGTSGMSTPKNNENNVRIAVANGDINTVERLIKTDADVNCIDADGRTLLHFSIDNGHINIVRLLLKNGAIVNKATHKGNTPLHTAVSSGHKEIVEELLKHFVSRDKLHDFINAKTTGSGTTSLHVAAKNGHIEIVNCLLKHGAIYDIKNNNGKTPLDFSKDQNIISLLKLISEYFEEVKMGKESVTDKLEKLKSDKLSVITNTRNEGGKSLVQVALTNKHQELARKLLLIFKI